MVVVRFLVFVIIISIKIITIVIIIFIMLTQLCTDGGRVLVLVIPGNECSSSRRRSWHFCRFPGFLPSQLCLGAGWPVRQDHYLSHTATYQHCSATYHCTCHCVIRWNCHQTSGTIGNSQVALFLSVLWLPFHFFLYQSSHAPMLCPALPPSKVSINSKHTWTNFGQKYNIPFA